MVAAAVVTAAAVATVVVEVAAAAVVAVAAMAAAVVVRAVVVATGDFAAPMALAPEVVVAAADAVATDNRGHSLVKRAPFGALFGWCYRHSASDRLVRQAIRQSCVFSAAPPAPDQTGHWGANARLWPRCPSAKE